MLQDAKANLQNVYREGIFTRALGRPCTSNPYPVDTIDNLLWEKGWRLIDATHAEREVDQFRAVLADNYAPENYLSSVGDSLWRLTFAIGLGAIFIWAAVYSSLLR